MLPIIFAICTFGSEPEVQRTGPAAGPARSGGDPVEGTAGRETGTAELPGLAARVVDRRGGGANFRG